MKTIEVYVERTADEDADARQVYWEIPEGITQADVLEHGWAIDGTSAAKTAEAYTDNARRAGSGTT